MEDWFRNSKWNNDIEKGFFARLARSRSNFHKAQYLKIQALTLYEYGFLEKSFELAEKVINEYIEEKHEVVPSLNIIANCYAKQKDIIKAIEYYLKCIDLEATINLTTNVRHDFGLFVVENKLNLYYDRLLSELIKNEQSDVFPISIFNSAYIRACIYSERNNLELAEHYAQKALDITQITKTQFRYHQSLGLINNPKKEYVNKINSILKNQFKNDKFN